MTKQAAVNISNAGDDSPHGLSSGMYFPARMERRTISIGTVLNRKEYDKRFIDPGHELSFAPSICYSLIMFIVMKYHHTNMRGYGQRRLLFLFSPERAGRRPAPFAARAHRSADIFTAVLRPCLIGLAACAASVYGAAWQSADIGIPLAPSAAIEKNGAWTITSKMPSSADKMADYLTFVCQKWTGDFVLSAEVACAADTFPDDQIGRVGLFVRESRADPGGRFISLGAGRRQDMFIELRRASGARRESYNAICGHPTSKRFQLKRVGNVFEARFGDGASGPVYYLVTTELDLAQNVWVGFGVRPDGLDTPVRGLFKNIKLYSPNAEEANDLAFRDATPVVWRAAVHGVRDEAAVSQWTDTSGQRTATLCKTVNGMSRPPIWRAAALNGEPALRFDGTNTLLAVRADLNPMGWAYRGTVICVFQTRPQSPAGTLISCDAAYAADNLADDWGLSLGADGVLSAHFGFLYQWDVELRSRQKGLNDGQPHVAIFSWGGEDRRLRLNVDGQVTDRFFAFWRARGFLEMTFGGMPNGKGPFFAGELAEIVFIKNHTLTRLEENRLGLALAKKYGVQKHSFVPVTAAKTDIGPLASVLSAPAAIILHQPSDQTVKRGAIAEFEVVANGRDYQWFCDGRPVERLTTARIRVATGKLPESVSKTVFECRVSQGADVVFSRKAALRVE